MPGEKHRSVIDTNLWISFLLTGDFTKLDRLLSTGQVSLLLSEELLEEIIEVAGRPKFRKYFDLADLTDLLANLKQIAELVRVSSQVNACRDNKDNFLLALAVDGAATHVVTGDQDLLTLHPFGEIKVVTIADYLSGS